MSLFVNLVSMVLSWVLGLYLVIHGFRNIISWLVATAVWCATLFFTNNVLELNPPQNELWTVLLPAATLGIPAWLSVSFGLRLQIAGPSEPAWKNIAEWSTVIGAYFVILVLLAGNTFAIRDEAVKPGSHFPFLLIYVTFVAIYCLYNYWQCREQTKADNDAKLSRISLLLLVTTVFVMIFALLRGIFGWLFPTVSLYPYDAFIGAGVCSLGYAVIQYNTLVSDETSRIDILQILIGVILSVMMLTAIALAESSARMISPAWLIAIFGVTAAHTLSMRLAKAFCHESRNHKESPVEHSTPLLEKVRALSPRQREALEFKVKNLSDEEIAEQMGIEPSSVTRYMKRISKQLETPISTLIQEFHDNEIQLNRSQ